MRAIGSNVPGDARSARMPSWRAAHVIAFVAALGFIAVAALAAERYIPADALSTQLAAVVNASRATHATAVVAATVFFLFVLATCLGCPINLCIAACMIVLGPMHGFAAAFAGTLASAAILHALGGLVSVRRVARWFGRRRTLRREVRRSVLAVALVRLVPVAPYAVVSLFAGAMRVPHIRYLAGTALGMAPGIVVYAVFIDRAAAVLRGAHAPAALAAAGAALLAFAIWIACSRRARRRGMPP